MIGFTARARRQVTDLLRHYRRELRIEAARNLQRAITEAVARIESEPLAGLPAPRPYPGLAQTGQAWCKAGRYWFRYSLTSPAIVTAVFYDAANMPDRVSTGEAE